jgi:hypothetical protein
MGNQAAAHSLLFSIHKRQNLTLLDNLALFGIRAYDSAFKA